MPSGAVSARYSPATANEKLVCKGCPESLRSLPDAKTIRVAFAAREVSGKVHCCKSVLRSLKLQPARLIAEFPVLRISIQSEYSPSSSASVLLFCAMNSLITGWAAAGTSRHARAANRMWRNREYMGFKKEGMCIADSRRVSFSMHKVKTICPQERLRNVRFDKKIPHTAQSCVRDDDRISVQKTISLRWTQCRRLLVGRVRGGRPYGSFSRGLFRQHQGIWL